jgi:hypothetical protein
MDTAGTQGSGHTGNALRDVATPQRGRECSRALDDYEEFDALISGAANDPSNEWINQSEYFVL